MSFNGEQWVVYEGKGKHIVFVSGDEEYRSEEALTLMAQIMSVRHGFKCTVLYAIDPETGVIDPVNQTNIPGLHNLESADMMVLSLRFRELPDEQMKYIIDYTNAGKPVMGLRTATHAFNYTRNKDSVYAKYDFSSQEFPGGYGRQVFGETWVNHHGHHGKESTRGVINGEVNDHPILKGVKDIWGTTDVYTITKLTGDPDVLVYGLVLVGMDPGDQPNYDKPIMPLAWVKNYTGELGKTSRIFCTTMGASVDLKSEGLRRLLVNGCYWCMGMEDQIPECSNVDYVVEYEPLYFGFASHKKNVRPSDLKL